MSACVSKTLSLSSSLEKQGILSILNSDSGISSNMSAASLRRTLSADMSSKNWLSQNGLRPMLNVSSSEEPHSSIGDSISREEDDYDEIWAQIQDQKKKKKEEEERERAQTDIWSSILSKKTGGNHEPLPPPYIHPLVRRSSSSLSEKSLEICTESLGSETGSDEFSSHPASEKADAKEAREMSMKIEPEVEEIRVSKSNYLSGKKLPPRSFPPPIPSLSRENGRSVRMNTRRQDGRTVLEAVSVSSENNFFAKRDHGRLVLTVATSYKYNDGDEEEMNFEMEEAFESSVQERKEEEEEEADEESNMSSGIPTSAKNKKGLLAAPEAARSLPPRPRLARSVAPSSTVDDTIAAACFNGYETHWRLENPISAQSPKIHGGGGEDTMVSWLKGCREQRRSYLFMEPFCIATT